MGCDIHGMIEFKAHTMWNGCVNINTLNLRNYNIYSHLFNAKDRNEDNIKAMADNRGLPFDVSEETEYIYYNEKEQNGYIFHSESYIMYKEFIGRLSIICSGVLTEKHKDWSIVHNMMKILAKTYGEENIRLVVWFDN